MPHASAIRARFGPPADWHAASAIVVLDDTRATPSELKEDGRDYVPTNKWVLLGHHFAAIAGPGPLIGPTLAAQFGFLPGLSWLVIGVCLGVLGS